MERKNISEAINCAIEGFVYVFKTQKTLRYHFVIGAAVLISGIYLNFSRIEILILSSTITFVLVAEIANTVVELLIDLLVNVYNPIARIIKDVAAGMVLIAAINAVIIGYLLFFRGIIFKDVDLGLLRIRQSNWHLTFISFIVVFTIVLFMKIFLHKGTPMKGGMPSGHAAVAFSFWTAIAFVTRNELVILLTFILAALIARERIVRKVHNIWEVMIGAFLGIITTILIFQIFKI